VVTRRRASGARRVRRARGAGRKANPPRTAATAGGTHVSHAARGTRGASPQALLRRLRAFCLALPEASETDAWGHPNWRAGKKTFAVLETYRGELVITFKAQPQEQQLLADDPRFFIAPYVGKHGWLCMRVGERVDWKLTRELLLRSYRLVALKRMVQALDAKR
jgi:predicted DNA-binding protein (MmcQ/YjbR family)